MINDFKGIYFFLSNFYPTVVKLDGTIFPSVEHAYQAAKSDDPDYREKVRILTEPGGAKRLGKKTKLREDWETVKIEVMRDLLKQKFAPGSEPARQLLLTLDHELVEGNWWGDTFWGVCKGVGSNHLGKLLMEIRDELRKTPSDPQEPEVP